jgi:hypothetical protein
VPLVEVPRLVSAVPRTTELTELTALFTDSVKTRTPKVAVLAGVTGFGKTTIAADFCHLNRHFYEYVCWIDSRSRDLIDARITDITAQFGHDTASIDDAASAFRTEFARLGGPFLLVFDGARSREDIDPYIPTSGCGFVIVTSTNSTGWWHTATQRPIEAFTEEEASACFRAYANLERGTHTSTVASIVDRLKRVPLAIAMAALYFRNADEDLTHLSAQYFTTSTRSPIRPRSRRDSTRPPLLQSDSRSPSWVRRKEHRNRTGAPPKRSSTTRHSLHQN